MSAGASPLRLFLDTGVIIAGLFQRWRAAKAILTLCTFRQRYSVLLAADVERELRGILSRKGAISATDRHALQADLAGWMRRVRIERVPAPLIEDVERYLPIILPVIRHINDLRPVVAALQARPDWVISGNREHWNDALAHRTGLRILTPQEFVRRLTPET